MSGGTIKIRSRVSTGEFDCYLALPDNAQNVPAVVLACAVHGLTKDLCDIADEFAANGYIAAAPNLFWRANPSGVLSFDDERARTRAQPRLQKIKDGEIDMEDTLAEVKKLPQSNGCAIVMGFCYGGPYAIIAPKRLGYDGGISCHGTLMGSYIDELKGVSKPICIMSGDRDHAAPPDVLQSYRAVSQQMKNVEIHVFPGVDHGYAMPSGGALYNAAARSFSMKRALAMLDDLRSK